MARTFLDELVEYPAKTIQKFGTTNSIVSLLTDEYVINPDESILDEVYEKYLFDYGYVDNTVTESRAFVCVEAELNRTPTATMQDFRLYVTVLCHKEYMTLDPKKFRGIIGNRRDNLVREIDKVLNGSDAFGIGSLVLESVRTVGSPAGFTARELTYSVSDFRNKGVVR